MRADTFNGSKETILVVEDVDELRKMICQILIHHGYRVLEAADGHQALEVSAAHADGIHLLLTDVVMPRMDGGELAERLRRINPRLRMVFMSGYANDVRVRSIHHQRTMFLPKPFTSKALACKVREALDAPAHE